MTLARPIGRLCGVIAAVAAILAVAIHVSWSPAAVTGPVPATANVSIVMTGPVTNLTAGSEVHFTVNTANGVTLNKVHAKICVPGFSTYSTSNFSYSNASGVRCVYGSGITSGGLTGVAEPDGYQLGPIPFSSVTTSGDQFFKAGTGTVNWTNLSGFGPAAPLTCDDTHPCDLVINVGMTNDAIAETWFIQPLTFAGSGTTTTTSTSSTTTSSTSSTTTSTSSTTTSSTSSTTTSSTSSTTTIPTTTTTTLPTTTTTTIPGSTTTTAPGSTTTTIPPITAGTVTPSTVAPGGSITVQSTGWKPGSSVNVTLHSDPVTLGALTAANDGTVSGAFTVPAGTPTGAHSVVLDGTDPQNAAKQATLDVTVAASSGGAGTPTAGSGTSTGSANAGALAFTGDLTRNLVSVALLLLATGLFLLGQASRRRVDEPS